MSNSILSSSSVSSSSVPNIQDSLDDWTLIKELLPYNWNESCETHNVLKGNRKIKDASVLLRILLLHIGKGYSLMETSVRSKLSGLLDISDVGILNALRRSELWLKDMCEALYLEQKTVNSALLGNIKKKIRLVDGSVVKEPGKTGSYWRINYSFSFPNFECDYFNLVNAKGKGNGESIASYPVKNDECIIADRNYSRFNQISYVVENGADIIVRANTVSYDCSGDKINLLSNLRILKEVGDYDEWDVYIKDIKNTKRIKGRICAIRKDEGSTNEAIKKIKDAASRKNKNTRADTFEYAKYVIIFTTFTKEECPTYSILSWYRTRWQIELAFKRLKSITSLGHLPKYSDKSSKAWIYGKLLIALLTEKFIRVANIKKNTSP